MDGQLAFFRVRPAKAMGRKGAEPNSIISPRHSNAPSTHGASSGPVCRISAPRKCGDGEAPPWGLCPAVWSRQGHSRGGLPCARARCAGGEGRVQPVALLVCHLPGLVWSQVWSHTASPKPPFKWGLPVWGQSLCGAPKGTFGLARPFGASQCPLSSPGTARLGSEAAIG